MVAIAAAKVNPGQPTEARLYTSASSDLQPPATFSHTQLIWLHDILIRGLHPGTDQALPHLALDM